jgi:soluble lytic murein transglycosylase-like protein
MEWRGRLADERLMVRAFLILCVAGLAGAQSMPQAPQTPQTPQTQQAPQNPYEAVRAAMEASAAKQRESVQGAMEPSLEKQRASVRKQAETAMQVQAADPAHSFFTVPWPQPAAMLMSMAVDCDPVPAAELNGLIHDAAQREGLEPDLLRAVIRKESGFRPCAVSPKGAQGLMQLMPATAADLRVADPFDARQNIDGGTRLLKSLLARYSGDLSLALGAYNAGAGAVDHFGGVPPYPETLNYVSDILKGVQ